MLLEKIKEQAFVFKFASDRLKRDKNFIIQAMNQNGLTLEYIDTDLQKDKDIVRAAVSQNVDALQFASNELKSNGVFILDIMDLINHKKDTLHVLEKYKINREICSILKHVSDPLKKARHL